MGALRIEVANLEDAVVREADLVARQERDLASSQGALLAEAFRGRVHDTTQAITALIPGLEQTQLVYDEAERPPSPPMSPKMLGLDPTLDHSLVTFASSIATVEEPKHQELSTLCGSLND